MKIGDLVDDGFGCFGIIVEFGWIYPTGSKRQRAYKVHFPTDTAQNGWYEGCDLKLISYPVEEICK